MFTSVLFDDINKAAFDVLKDGYSFDQKATMKSTYRGCNMSLEGKNFTSAFSGKFSIDFKPCTYLTVKKLSVENNGTSVCDIDIPNVVNGMTLMLRTQGNAINYDVKKVSCGMKFMKDNFAQDITFDVISQKYSTSSVFSHKNMIMGIQLQGSQEQYLADVNVGAAYCYKECVFSATTSENHSVITGAILAKPYKNIQFGATCRLPIVEAQNPSIAFGVCIKPTPSSETRVKVGTDGKLAAFYKSSVSKNVIVSATCGVDFNNFLNGSHKVGIAMEIQL